MGICIKELRARIAAAPTANGGATAVEFAIIAAPFLFFLFVLFDLGLLYSISASLDNAIAQTARQIRTGSAQTQGMGPTDFKNAVCGNLAIPSANCGANLSLDVRAFSCFRDVTTPTAPVTNQTVDPTKLVFNMGGPGDIIVVRAYYKWGLLAPLLENAVTPLKPGQVLVTASTAFRNEPYGQTTPTPPSCN
ncbi:pilus assembly protein TadE [Caulobacter sp. CCUG 60055]|uniref:TadE/TadG family type IV pilus assembly protein n=1 Tax=Caulobacter sp. CCUG 60055 TaxID=2100090 RepID=UPI001FA7E780|nr:TadE/TadG family type IV pilus assembly protein [Caulobacter sp. CCUG 60055]MBQ1541904.1 pilus assembly protein [Caulobacteraceae bacterium]MCI3181241.1 pilus assembly protein TadE [Caulobacter sp. CCUG 60055]